MQKHGSGGRAGGTGQAWSAVKEPGVRSPGRGSMVGTVWGSLRGCPSGSPGLSGSPGPMAPQALSPPQRSNASPGPWRAFLFL